MTTFQSKIQAKGFQNQDPFPVRPNKPAKPHQDATSAVFADYATKLAKYEQEMVVHQAAVDAWRAKDNQLSSTFVTELFAEHGVTDCRFARALYSHAYETGHSSGYSEVACVFHNMIELWTVYKEETAEGNAHA